MDNYRGERESGGKGASVQPLENVRTSPILRSTSVRETSNHKQSDKQSTGTDNLRIPHSLATILAHPGSILEEPALGTFLEPKGTSMVDVRPSPMMKPCVIGSPPPSVLRERSKMKRERMAQSRLAAGKTQNYEETVLPSTGETPAIHLSCSDDMSPQDEDDILDIRELGQENPDALGANRLSSDRSNSLTPPPRLISFNLPESAQNS